MFRRMVAQFRYYSQYSKRGERTKRVFGEKADFLKVGTDSFSKVSKFGEKDLKKKKITLGERVNQTLKKVLDFFIERGRECY